MLPRAFHLRPRAIRFPSSRGYKIILRGITVPASSTEDVTNEIPRGEGSSIRTNTRAQDVLKSHIDRISVELLSGGLDNEQLASRTKNDLALHLSQSKLYESGLHKILVPLGSSAEVILVQLKDDDNSILSIPGPKSIVVPLRWLRENCRCSECVNPDTLQRRVNVLDTQGHHITSITTDVDGFQIQWNHGSASISPHASHYNDEWLRKALFEQYPFRKGSIVKDGRHEKLFFHESTCTLPEINYDEVVRGTQTVASGMGILTDHIMKTGFVLVRRTPATPEATEDLLGRIGPLRNTHYGGFYDFQPNLEFKDTAYTNEALELHTDTTYFTEPAGLQAFHLLSHTPPAERKVAAQRLGGETLLLDGLHCAERLRNESPESFEILCNTKLPWHASGNEDVAIAPLKPFPVIERTAEGSPFRIRWNNADRGVVPTSVGLSSNQWYGAAAKWQALLTHPSMNLKLQLEPGTVLVFDNWRVLHGRTSFQGARRMSGGYINRDDFISRWRLGQAQRAEVVDSIMRLDAQTL